MICVECDGYVSSLYTKYSNDHIKLTDCSKCGRTADKYIEFDNVLLFIDILLLKPQAYKHVVFNVMNEEYHTGIDMSSKFKRWLVRRRVQRTRLLSVLFEIYLTWAYKEKFFNSSIEQDPYLIYYTILKQKVAPQYLLFALKCASDDILTHTLVHKLCLKWFHWKPQSVEEEKTIKGQEERYLKGILSLTILISGAMKIFPILTLIWPYDNVTITNVIGSIATWNLVEALRVVTNLSTWQTTEIFVVISVLKFLVTRLLLIVVLSKFNLRIMERYLTCETHQLLDNFHKILGLHKLLE